MKVELEGRKAELESEVDCILSSARGGRVTITKETQSVDLKEEAGRRNGKEIEPGYPENPDAAVKLADEVACMANSPGGGALIVGIADKTGDVIGTELDVDWLREQIYNKIDVAPDIAVRTVEGQRVLALYVAPSPEPVHDTANRLRWRVGSSCKPVDRSEWWEHQRQRQNLDVLAQDSAKTLADVRERAVDLARRALSKREDEVTDLSKEDFLRRLGALGPKDALSGAGAMLFTAMNRVAFEVTILDVHGGAVQRRVSTRAEESLLEQLDEVETVLSAVNRDNTVIEGFLHTPVPEIPVSAVREALLNGIIHRDWNRREPTDVRWIDLDSTLVVRSPGGFPPDINAKNILSNRFARYPALADIFRAVGLVDKQGVGVDRMYQAMITLGHRPPLIEEVAGPCVETALVGGAPVLPVLQLVSAIVPAPRQNDFRIAVILYLLFHRSFITEEDVAEGLQTGLESARVALTAALQTTIDGVPMITKHEDAWLLGDTARDMLHSRSTDSVYELVPYLSTESSALAKLVRQWTSRFGAIATKDLMALSGVSRGTAKKCIDDMVEDGELRLVGGGRSTKYVPAT